MWQREMAAGAKVFGNRITNGTKEVSLDLACLLSSTASDILKHCLNQSFELLISHSSVRSY